MHCLHTRKSKHEGTFSMFTLQSGKHREQYKTECLISSFMTRFSKFSHSPKRKGPRWKLADVGRSLSSMSVHHVLFHATFASSTPISARLYLNSGDLVEHRRLNLKTDGCGSTFPSSLNAKHEETPEHHPFLIHRSVMFPRRRAWRNKSEMLGLDKQKESVRGEAVARCSILSLSLSLLLSLVLLQ